MNIRYIQQRQEIKVFFLICSAEINTPPKTVFAELRPKKPLERQYLLSSLFQTRANICARELLVFYYSRVPSHFIGKR